MATSQASRAMIDIAHGEHEKVDRRTKELARFAAYLHNCMRYNKLSMLKLVDPDLHKQMTNSGLWKVHIMVCAFLGLTSLCPWGYVRIAGGDLKVSPANAAYLGGITTIATLLISAVLQLALAAYSGCNVETAQQRNVMHPCTYTFIFHCYNICFKLMQSSVVLSYAPNVVYANHLLIPFPGLQHAGIFVVGAVVSAVQANVIVYALVAFHYGTVAWLTVVCFAIVRVLLLFANFFMSPSARTMALIDATIEQHDLGPLLMRLSKRTSFSITREELGHLEQLSGDLNQHEDREKPGKVLPGSTHAIEILYNGPSMRDLAHAEVSQEAAIQAGENLDNVQGPFPWRRLNLSDGAVLPL